MSEYEIAASIDITRDVCPITFVKTKLELEDLAPGEVLEVTIREGESLENVTRSCRAEGHEVLTRRQVEGPIWRVLIRRGLD